MNSARPFVGLMFLAFLAANAPPEARPESGQTPPVLGARVRAPHRPDVRFLNRATRVEGISLASMPVDEARREAGSKGFEEFSGGPIGTLLVSAGLVAAVALFLAVAIPW